MRHRALFFNNCIKLTNHDLFSEIFTFILCILCILCIKEIFKRSLISSLFNFGGKNSCNFDSFRSFKNVVKQIRSWCSFDNVDFRVGSLWTWR